MNKAVKEYQCVGCFKVSSPECFSEDRNGGIGCGNHSAGTSGIGIGKIFLGMPKGFDLLNECTRMKPLIFESFEKAQTPYDMYNIPVWKYLKNGHTFVRGLSPRINTPFIDIYLENCIDKINCLEITEQHIANMG